MESLPLMIRAAVIAVLGAAAVLTLTLGRRRRRACTDLGLWAPAAAAPRAKSDTVPKAD
jgi:hypothetical protein